MTLYPTYDKIVTNNEYKCTVCGATRSYGNFNADKVWLECSNNRCGTVFDHTNPRPWEGVQLHKFTGNRIEVTVTLRRNSG